MDEYFKEELDSAFGEVPRVVDERIMKEVRMGMKGRKRKGSMKKVTVVTLAAVMVLGTVVFADDIYKIVVKRTNYSTEFVNQKESAGNSISPGIMLACENNVLAKAMKNPIEFREKILNKF